MSAAARACASRSSGVWLAARRARVRRERDRPRGRRDLPRPSRKRRGRPARSPTWRPSSAACRSSSRCPTSTAPERLQIMTIHKAKGLEFDTVIVPGLEGPARRDDRKLFMWMQTPADRLLLAPINATGSDDDPIHKFIRGIDKQRADHENGRLLYVAATRAKEPPAPAGQRAGWARTANPHKPQSGSLLAKLWPVCAGAVPRPAAACRGRGRRCAGPGVEAGRAAAPGTGALALCRRPPARRVDRRRRARSEARGDRILVGRRHRAPRGQRRAPLAAAHRGGWRRRTGRARASKARSRRLRQQLVAQRRSRRRDSSAPGRA